MGDVGSIGCDQTSPKDGIASAKTGNGLESGMVGPYTVNEHIGMEDVVSISAVPSSSKDGIASYKEGMDFEFGKNDKSKELLKKPIGPLFSVQFGNIPSGNLFNKKHVVWNDKGWSDSGVKAFKPTILSNQFSADVHRFVEKLKQGFEELALKMEYSPSFVSIQSNGNRRIEFTAEEVYKGAQACSLQLYGYFVGTSMDYRVVRDNLMRMWRIHGIKDITKTNSGIFYFKFKSKDGMKTVLDSGPWMVQNVRIVLNIWEPGIWLEKNEPTSIPIWVSVFNIPMELCNGNGIGKIMSGVGKPLANEDLPSVLEIAYPPLGNRPAKIGKLDVKYQWKPPLCTHCKPFGHTTLACKIRLRTEEELVVASMKQSNIVPGVSIGNEDGIGKGDDGFVTVGKRNMPVSNRSKNVSGGQSKVMQGGNKQRYTMKKSFPKQGSFAAGYVKNNFSKPGGGVNQFKNQVKDNSNAEGQKKFVQKNEYRVKSSAPSKPKSLQQISKDPNFKPKVLLRGSTSKNSFVSASEEAILIKNSFQVLEEEDMDQKEVDILMEDGIYPSKTVRLDWTIHQMDYFYKNCHKFCLDPSFEDEDVESEKDSIASDMKPEFETRIKAVAWNVKGLNKAPNQNQVIRLLREDKYNLCGLLETHVKKRKIARICRNVFGNWDWISNNACCSGGTRIIVGWDPNCVNVMVMEQSAQVIHCYVEPLNGDNFFYCSFIYHVHTIERSLWRSLQKYKRSIQDEPWVILGDFNATLDPSEKSTDGSKITTAMGDFRECVSDFGMEDIAMSGLRFTWNKKPGKKRGLLKKLDRVMGNVEFMFAFPSAFALFLPFMTSDHTPVVLVIPECDVEGFSMFSLVSKLKMLKKPLRKLNFEHGNLFEKVKVLRNELADIQSAVSADPHYDVLREAELKCFNAYNVALRDEESFLRQKAKTEWLKEGDRNSKYFNNVVKGRQNRSRISVVENLNGIPFFGNEVGGQFVAHFQSVLGRSSHVCPIKDLEALFHKKISPSDAAYMVRDISVDEIKSALFDIDGNKAPGLDGFSSHFFKSSWDVIGVDLCKAVKEFFRSGKLLKEVNSIVIALVPKSPTPKMVSDYRPIACCNVIYKIISKVIVGRIKNCLGDLVDINQSAFIPNRQISDNILLSEELMRGYHSGKGVARCAFKEATKARILNIMPFKASILLARYLGVPLISKRLYCNDCQPLIDRVSIANEVERLTRNFLWNFGEFKRGKAKMRWSDVCKPKIEGG
ncbi:putative reverse transcriptase domain-containing protein [Tanacetum coccineum]